MTRLNLAVIRSSDIHGSVKFYEQFGLKFELHSHGKGPEHYATLDTDTVFEIYPATTKMPVTVGTRIGFEVDSCEGVSQRLIDAGYNVKTLPSNSPWGVRPGWSQRRGGLTGAGIALQNKPLRSSGK